MRNAVEFLSETSREIELLSVITPDAPILRDRFQSNCPRAWNYEPPPPYLAAITAINSAHATMDETVRTWFHVVQTVR